MGPLFINATGKQKEEEDENDGENSNKIENMWSAGDIIIRTGLKHRIWIWIWWRLVIETKAGQIII